jgi:hypothetical protein
MGELEVMSFIGYINEANTKLNKGTGIGKESLHKFIEQKSILNNFTHDQCI